MRNDDSCGKCHQPHSSHRVGGRTSDKLIVQKSGIMSHLLPRDIVTAYGAIGNGAIGNGAIGNDAIGNGAIGNGAIGNGAIGNDAIGNGVIDNGAIDNLTLGSQRRFNK